MHKHHRHPESPNKKQHMVSGCEYYRKRADVDRGLKKRDFPSVEQTDPSQEKQDRAVEADKVSKH